MTKSADLQRLASLSDCVFAVAMTLLAFSVRIPEQGLDRAKLPGELVRMLRESSGLVLSFAITAMFWLGQVRLLHSLRQATVGLFYLALLQLFWIVLLPISTSLRARVEVRETVLVMGMNLALIALAGLLMWIYCYRKSLFESVAVGRSIAVELVGPIFPLLVFAISLVVTLWTPVLGDKLWWGAFATPFLVHFTRSARSPAEAQATKAAVVQDKNVNDSPGSGTSKGKDN
jgi:TMEM175 potassium channel family protein